MRKVVVQEFLSLDGFVAGPGDDVDFIPASTRGDESLGRQQMTLMERVDTLLLGRITYEMFAGYWPKVTEGPEKDFADRFNGLSKVVFSGTLERAPWGNWKEAAIVPHGPAEEVARLKRESGADLMVSGSISVARSLIEAGAVDEYRLVLCPVVLGSGRRLFPEADGISLHFDEVTALERGGVSLVYSAVDAHR
jgi:dihydrofolate reductase